MAMSAETRKVIKESREILNIYINGSNKVKHHINEATSSKMVNLQDIQSYLSSKELSHYGKNSFITSNGVLSVSFFLMSSNNNKVVDSDPNCVHMDYSLRDTTMEVSTDVFNTELKNFVELTKTNHGKDKMSSKDVVKLCDAAQIYDIYQENALSIMRKMFSHPYYMFTGPNIYKTRKKGDITLYVRYDKLRKKFEYAYNPEFILECAIDEWCVNRSSYSSLESCYVYILAFLITHEMLHIIHHNTTISGGMGEMVSSGDHEVNNIIQDSFINCKIARRYLNVSGVNTTSRNGKTIAPIPSVGVGSDIVLRVRHNEGLKKFDSLDEVLRKISEVITKLTKVDYEYRYYSTKSIESFPIGDYQGCDLFIRIDVSPTFTPLRSNGSSTFQRCVDDIIRVLTDGKVYSKYTKISNAEKVSDLTVLPEGTLVTVRGTHDIVYVASYDADEELYSLTKSKLTGTKVAVTTEGVKINTPVYENTYVDYGSKKKRVQIRPYDPRDDAYAEADMPKQKKLSPEDLKRVKEADDINNMSEEDKKKAEEEKKALEELKKQLKDTNSDKQVKVLNVGDIVWIHRLKKFGRITSINNGQFTVEEVIEKPAKIIDDSDNY